MMYILKLYALLIILMFKLNIKILNIEMCSKKLIKQNMV
jgi:hypothetical protein